VNASMPPEDWRASVHSLPLKILFMATQLPMPPDTGGRIRSLNILKHLANQHEVTFVCTVDPSIHEKHLDEMGRVCPRFIPVPQRQLHRSSWRYLLQVVLNLASSCPFAVAKDHSPALARQIQRLLSTESFDVLVCDFLHASINLSEPRSLPVVLFEHNVEAEIFRRYYRQHQQFLGRLFWRYQWTKMRRYEGRVSSRMDHCITVSRTDKVTLQRDYGVRNVSSIETGVDVKHFLNGKAEKVGNRLVFTGSMDWIPNQDAMLWFAEEILPRIARTVPDVSLTIVGRRPGKKVQQLSRLMPQIQVTGRVDDVRPYLWSGSVFIVPLRIGGGTRIKIFEAMASGIPVVSTAVGAEGLQVAHGRHLLLADTAEAFSSAVIWLLQNPTGARQLAAEAKSLVAEHHDWNLVSQQFVAICRDVIKNRNTSHS
jgi:sugar transferase (PEP-CTERM/EpsH1 system associated)